MARIHNREPCPPAIVAFVLQKCAETERRQKHPHWFRRFFWPEFPNPSELVADVRWFSECDVSLRECSGYLLGRWIMHTEGIKPLEYDFSPCLEPGPGDIVIDGTVDPFHCMVYNCAMTVEADKCVVVQINPEGRVQRFVYELPDGINSESFGPLVGEEVHERFKRDPWDDCVPPGWKPGRPEVGS